MKAFDAIAAKAEEIGWPIAYQTDLTVHDLRECRALQPSSAFLWVLRECGTHLIAASADVDGVKLESYLTGVEKHMGPCRYFWWDAGTLVELGDLEEACFVLEDRVSELRHRRQGAA